MTVPVVIISDLSSSKVLKSSAANTIPKSDITRKIENQKHSSVWAGPSQTTVGHLARLWQTAGSGTE